MQQAILRRNNVTLLGSGAQPMLFAHGFGCDQQMWRFITPAFADSYRLILFDYVGSGRSDRGAYDAERYDTLAGYTQDVVDICTALDLRDVIFVGHSVSSMIGVLAAIQAPERFARLILVAPSPCYLNLPPDYHGGFERAEIAELLDLMEKNHLGWASLLAPTVMGHPEHPGLSRELEASFCAADPTIARQFAAVTFYSDNRADLAQVATPSLILQCSDDALAPLAVGDYLGQHLPDSTLRVMRATGHCPHLSAPAETVELMLAYLEAQRTGMPARDRKGPHG